MRGPRDGYISGPKRHYRRRIWNLLESREPMASTPKRDRTVLILDEWQAHESRYLIEQRGYQPNQIHVANLSPAKVARVTLSLRRAGYEGVTVHSKGLTEACVGLTLAGVRVHAIHADFCQNVTSPGLMNDITGLRAPLVMSQGGSVAVAVNILRGRETDLWRITRDSLADIGVTNAEDAARVRLLSLMLNATCKDGAFGCLAHLESPASDSYASTNGQTMLFLVATLNKCVRAVASEPDAGRSWLSANDRLRVASASRLWSIDTVTAPYCSARAVQGLFKSDLRALLWMTARVRYRHSLVASVMSKGGHR